MEVFSSTYGHALNETKPVSSLTVYDALVVEQARHANPLTQLPRKGMHQDIAGLSLYSLCYNFCLNLERSVKGG
jgi:hypothetical protein